jgi:hypothetical protein
LVVVSSINQLEKRASPTYTKYTIAMVAFIGLITPAEARAKGLFEAWRR